MGLPASGASELGIYAAVHHRTSAAALDAKGRNFMQAASALLLEQNSAGQHGAASHPLPSPRQRLRDPPTPPQRHPRPRALPVCRDTAVCSPPASGWMRRWYQVPASKPCRLQP